VQYKQPIGAVVFSKSWISSRKYPVTIGQILKKLGLFSRLKKLHYLLSQGWMLSCVAHIAEERQLVVMLIS